MEQNKDQDLFPILVHPNAYLKTKLEKEVETVTDEYKAIAQKMLKTMRVRKGCGLSATQVGLDFRLIVYDAGQGSRIMFNPKIKAAEPAIDKSSEGCLSFPKLKISVKRHETIVVEYLGEDNLPRIEEFTGWEARIIQHEIDHLNGITFLQRK